VLTGRQRGSKDHLLTDWFGHCNLIKPPEFLCVGADGYVTEDQQKRVPENPDKNQQSLLAVIYWPRSNRCSYYCGGDGNPVLAGGKMMEYLRDKLEITKPVVVMKLDHHGSAGEFGDGGLLKTLGSRKVIVTPGHQYGHPCMSY